MPNSKSTDLSLPSRSNKGRFVKYGTAITLSALLCVPAPVYLAANAYATESEQATEAAKGAVASVDSEVTRAYTIAALGLQGCDAATMEQSLLNYGFTKAEVLNFNLPKLRSVDAALADSIAALQSTLVAGSNTDTDNAATGGNTSDDQTQETTPDPTGSETEQPNAGTSTDPANPTEPANPTDPADPEESPDLSDDEDNTSEDTSPATTPDDNTAEGVTDNAAGETPTEGAESHLSSSATSTSSEPSYPAWTYEGSKEYVHRPVQQNLTTTKFIAIIGEPARQLAEENDLYASVMIAQAILESNSGNSQLAQSPNRNLFGIKGSYKGSSVSLGTLEDDGNGNMSAITAQFRTYSTFEESLKDYVNLLTKDNAVLYRGALKSVAPTYEKACAYLQGRYATDSSYAEKLCGIIETYDLTRYDESLDYELVETYQVPIEEDDLDNTITNKTAGSNSDEPLLEERDLVDLAIEATSHLGDKYVWGGNVPGAFDCSGLVSYSYKEALGMSIPRTTYYQCIQGEDVDFADLHMGDLVFFADDKGVCGHVGMYLGEGCYIEASAPGDVVKITSIEEKEPTFAKRICKTKPVEEDEENPAQEDLTPTQQ
ncbi:glucosaminidase domain-containing protein [Adlercreutzia sp. ZJ141]|uniref:glucosaminidase domain-containing protein n=1 Tax=Adlercreutzia sp. ZJ141 TaxID=2709406 RepID=UPI0013EA235C|nr:glucosaminidase domain-containing protein [Adlercreutzia sp. ZJ141]